MTDGIKNAVEALKRLEGGSSEKQQHDVYPNIKVEPLKSNPITKRMLWDGFMSNAPQGYVINSDNKDVIYTLLRYFCRIKNFDKENIVTSKPSLSKGLLIFGDYGVGKSLFFDIIRKTAKDILVNQGNPSLWFSQVSAGSFVDDYMRSAKDPSSTFNLKGYYKGKLYIDDLGFEKKAFNSTELFAEVLFERNRNKSITYATTNLKPSQLTERYGDRIGDRLPEMFNIIKWEGESFRE